MSSGGCNHNNSNSRISTTTTIDNETKNVVRVSNVSILLSFLSSLYVLIMGIAFVVVPTFMMNKVLFPKLDDSSCGKDDLVLLELVSSKENDKMMMMIINSLSRLMGGILISQSFLSLLMILPSWFYNNNSDEDNVRMISQERQQQFRLGTVSIAIVGLLFVIVGLIDDRMNYPSSSSNAGNSTTNVTIAAHDNDDDCSSNSSSFYQLSYVLGSGSLIIALSCTSMMISFWPSTDTTQQQQQQEQEITNSNNNNGDDDDDLTTPLLPSPEQQEDQDDNENNAIVPTSRIRGTRRLLNLAKPQIMYLYIGCIVLLIRLPFSISIPHFVSTTLGCLGRQDYAGARYEILLLFLLGTIDAVLDFWCVFLFGYANQRIVRSVRVDTFVSILKQEMAFFDINTSGELASRLNSDCGEMAGDLTWFFRFSIESVVRIIGITGYMLIRSPILGCYALSIVPFCAIINRAYGNWLSKNAIQVQDALAQANNVAQETFSCIRTVIAFASESYQYEQYLEKINTNFDLNIRQLFMTGVYYMVVSTFLINTVVQATLLYIGTSLIQQGKLTGEILLAFMLYQGKLQGETLNLFQSYSSLIKSSGAGDKVFALLDRSPKPPGTGSANVLATDEDNNNDPDGDNQNNGPQEGGTPQTTDTSTAVPPPLEAFLNPTATTSTNNEQGDPNDGSGGGCALNGNGVLDDHGADGGGNGSGGGYDIKMVGVQFSYPQRPNHIVLNDFSLDIPSGKTVALVGPSGCGKSTVMGLLQRFYDPTNSGGSRSDGGGGTIYVDGIDLRSLDIKKHRRQIGTVTQDPILFGGTIYSNIVYGCPIPPSRQQVVEAAGMAHAHDYISSFPEGYNTEVGERGIQLSGGQKQRIAIARAIIKKPSLLLLDEATSALDAESEQVVQQALDGLLKRRHGSNMTTVVVAHRLRTVRNADMIAFVKNGCVVELGTHDQLVQDQERYPNGYYRNMVEHANNGVLPDNYDG